MTKRVLAIGEVIVEIMATSLGRGFSEPIALVGPFPSGAPTIFIDQVARLGVPASMVGAVGNDDFGLLLRERLACDGVDIVGLRSIPHAATGSAFVRYRPDGDRDFVFNIHDSAAARVVLDEKTRSVIAQCHHVHIMGSSLFSPQMVSVIQAAVDDVKKRGGSVSFDPNGRKEMLDKPGMRDALMGFLAQTDLFLPSGEELTALTQAQDEAGALAELLDLGISAVVIKRGGAGASYCDRQTRIDVPGLKVNEIDPTGAGDCFGATFVACWLTGRIPEECLRLANASGAMAVTRRGPMEGTASMLELEAFLTTRMMEMNT